jgi:DNA-binding IclR family transcriptional regulator
VPATMPLPLPVPCRPAADPAPPTAAGRVLAVLAAFGPDHTSLSLSEISRRTGIALSTTHRLVGELRDWGALERGPGGRYEVGLRLLELGSLAPQGQVLRERALPFLSELHHTTRAHVHLAVRDGHEVVHLESLTAAGAPRVHSAASRRWPLHAIGTGQVLLAHADVHVQQEVLDSRLPKLPHAVATDVAQLRRTLAQVRRTGVAVVAGRPGPDDVSLAAPVRGRGDAVVAAVGLTVSRDRTPIAALVPAVQAAAQAISRALRAAV